ncbi:aldehyde dehydrogenase family protein [Streptomyces panaciradicis]|uniref:aldehyde dehydrogenase family protein n=1 Tax=Streptomyces panaciradicis TaxID=1470261 RepID=UPI00201CE0F3|nr:aldehyde dehydrogenase family protein [Streptomyces panaciradicis]MCL6672584.1 aldehyde dehydrogenase family protein [Streptomyces panaciradicis]
MVITRELLIDGKEKGARSGRTTSVINPSTGQMYATVAAAGVEDVSSAVDAAQAAFENWAGLDPSTRRAIFVKAADLMEQQREHIVDVMASEVGATRLWGSFNVTLAAAMLREAAALITAPRGEVLTTQQDGALSLAVREPLGVVAAFSPWNAPVILGTRSVAAALAAGNTVVLKPSEVAPLSAGLLIGDLLREAGLPDGVLNVITNDPADAPHIAEALITDAAVSAVNFTGSTHVGRIIGAHAARHLKPALLELGGKNAVIVLEDADVDYAVDAAAFAAFMNSGQICMSADRILVHESLAEEFIAKFTAKVAALPFGDPADPATVIGPLVNTDPDQRCGLFAARRVAALVEDAVAKGATVLVGGEIQDASHPATVLSAVPAHADLYGTETFGPLCVVDTFATDDEAVTMANDTDQGLTAGIITENGTHGLRVARRLRTGIVHINDQSVADDPQAPFGGVRSSGYGRFGGRWGIEAFSNTRWITLATQHASYPF